MALIETGIEIPDQVKRVQFESFGPCPVEFQEIPEYPEMVEQDGKVKALVSFFDSSLFSDITHHERRMIREAGNVLRISGYPVGMISNEQSFDAIKQQGSGMTFNGFVLYDGATRLYTPPFTSRAHLDDAYDDNHVFPVFQKDTSNMFRNPGLTYLNSSINAVSDWSVDGIIPIVISRNGVNREVLESIYQLGGLDQPYHQEFLSEIGDFVTNLPNARPVIR